MSSYVEFYIIKGLTKEEAKSIPSTISQEELDKTEYSYNEYHHEPFPWEEEIGTKKTMRYSYIDRFKAASEMYGKKATSISSRCWDSPSQSIVRFEDGSEATIDETEFEKYREEKEREVYLYHRDHASNVPGYQMDVNVDCFLDKLLNPDDMLKLAEEYFDANHGDIRNGWHSYNDFSPLEAIMTAYFKAKKQDAKIVLYID